MGADRGEEFRSRLALFYHQRKVGILLINTANCYCMLLLYASIVCRHRAAAISMPCTTAETSTTLAVVTDRHDECSHTICFYDTTSSGISGFLWRKREGVKLWSIGFYMRISTVYLKKKKDIYNIRRRGRSSRHDQPQIYIVSHPIVWNTFRKIGVHGIC